MDALPLFMRETYMVKPDSRLPVKDIYEDFRAWMVGKYGPLTWSNISQKQIYGALKESPLYAYARFREGYCLKGIAYKLEQKEEISTPIISPPTLPPILPPTLIATPEPQIKKGPPRITQIVVPRAFQNTV